ncbi:polysaccharide biosynthesis tyrosine autokinase [bacterium]|nr:polysaccharide biosynthesis tyrosine autokinase [bacterium]
MDERHFLRDKNFEHLIRSHQDRQPDKAGEEYFAFDRSSEPRFESPGEGRKTKPEDELGSYSSKADRPSDSVYYQSSALIDFFHLVYKRKWLIALCTMVIVIPVFIWLMTVTPIYETEASIIYEETNDTAFLLDLGQSFYSKSAILNMLEQIKSRSLATEVAKSLPEEIVRTFKLPEQPDKNFSRERFIAASIMNNLDVQNVRGADIIKIRIQASDPIVAKTIADAYVDHIIDWFLQKNRKEISNIRNFVESQISVFQDKLGKAEEELLNFKEQNDWIKLSEASSEVLSSLTDVEVAYTQAKTEREVLEQRKRYIEQKKQELLPSLVVSDNQAVQQIKRELVTLERQYAELQQQQGPDSQKSLASLKDRINRTKRELIDELMKNGVRENLADPLSQIRYLLQESINLEVELESYKAREQGLRNTLNEQNSKLQTLPKQELELARLIRTKEVNDKIYSLLLEKREEARITEAGKVGDVRVVDYADLPDHPIKPQKRKTLSLALALGLSLGMGLTFLLHSLDNSLKTEQDIEKFLDLPVLAAIPQIASNGALHRFGKKQDPGNQYLVKTISHIMTQSHIFEAYRSLQLNFSFFNPDKNLKSILVTSSSPGEGKTLTALNIAQFYAREGTNTLLIDCDLRRPMIHHAIKLDQSPGLSNFLADRAAAPHSYIQILNSDQFSYSLSVLTSGTLPPNPSELLKSKRMADLLAQLQEAYELIIIDAPPVIAVTDPILIGKKVDGVLLVLRSGKTTYEAAMKAKKILENSRIEIIGCLLNDIDLKNRYGYYKNFYYYSGKKAVQSGSYHA